MIVDLIILTDEKDELKRYVPSLVATFEYVNPKITIERKPTRHFDRENVPTARKLLFLLTGNQSRAADMVKRWLKYLYTVPNTKSKYFAVTVDGKHTAGGDEPGTKQLSEDSSSMNITQVDNIDHVELWVPQFMYTFFKVPRQHGTVYDVHNLSTEYELAKETEKHVQNLLTQLGFCKGTRNDIKCTFIVVRSGFKHHRRQVKELNDLKQSATDASIPVNCISTQSTSRCSYTDIIHSPIYGRPDIVTCVVLTMVSLGLIKRSRTFSSYCIELSKSFNTMVAVKIPLATIIITMHVLYALSMILFFAFFGLGFWNCAMIFRCLDVLGDKTMLTFYILANVCATALSLGLLWGIGWPTYGHVHYIDFVIGTVCITCFYIIWYSFVHYYIFYKKLRYKHGVFDLPYIWWEKKSHTYF